MNVEEDTDHDVLLRDESNEAFVLGEFGDLPVEEDSAPRALGLPSDQIEQSPAMLPSERASPRQL